MMAIFIIVTLAAIGVYLLTVSTGQIEAVTQDEQSTRAQQAARTGLDWAAYQLLINTGGTFATDCANAGARQVLILPQGFFSEVRCTSPGVEAEGGVNVRPYQIVARGCNNTAIVNGQCCVPSVTVPCTVAVVPTYVEREALLSLAR